MQRPSLCRNAVCGVAGGSITLAWRVGPPWIRLNDPEFVFSCRGALPFRFWFLNGWVTLFRHSDLAGGRPLRSITTLTLFSLGCPTLSVLPFERVGLPLRLFGAVGRGCRLHPYFRISYFKLRPLQFCLFQALPSHQTSKFPRSSSIHSTSARLIRRILTNNSP